MYVHAYTLHVYWMSSAAIAYVCMYLCMYARTYSSCFDAGTVTLGICSHLGYLHFMCSCCTVNLHGWCTQAEGIKCSYFTVEMYCMNLLQEIEDWILHPAPCRPACNGRYSTWAATEQVSWLVESINVASYTGITVLATVGNDEADPLGPVPHSYVVTPGCSEVS